MRPLALALLLLCAGSASPIAQSAILVVDGSCLKAVTRTDKTRIEIPLKSNGDPDLTRATILFVGVDYNVNCGRIEVRR